jgi:hypothetical protein
MRRIHEILFIVDGGVSPKNQLKNIIQSGCTAEEYSYDEISVDSSGDVSLYFKLVKEE